MIAKNFIDNLWVSIKDYKLAQLCIKIGWSESNQMERTAFETFNKHLPSWQKETRRSHYRLCSAASLLQSPVSKGLDPALLLSSLKI